MKRKVIVLNAVILRPGLLAYAEARSLEELKAAIAAAETVESYIGHPQTAMLLGVEPSRGEYVPADGDTVWVVRLKKRAAQPGDQNVNPADLEVLRVGYAEPRRIAEILASDGWGGWDLAGEILPPL